VSKFDVELKGRYINPPKLRGEGKLALSTIQLIECLYVLRNAQDSVNYSTNGPICNSKVRLADMWGEGAEQEPIIVAYRTRDHQAKSGVCPSKVRYSKANDLIQEELLNRADTISLEGNSRKRSYKHSHANRTVTETTSPRRGVGTREVRKL
jgi:hypothetical protein